MGQIKNFPKSRTVPKKTVGLFHNYWENSSVPLDQKMTTEGTLWNRKRFPHWKPKAEHVSKFLWIFEFFPIFLFFGKWHCAEKTLRWPTALAKRFVSAKNHRGQVSTGNGDEDLNLITNLQNFVHTSNHRLPPQENPVDILQSKLSCVILHNITTSQI